MLALRQCIIYAVFCLFPLAGLAHEQEGDVVRLSPTMRNADLDAEQIRAMPCKALRDITVKAELKSTLKRRKLECLRSYNAFTPDKDLH